MPDRSMDFLLVCGCAKEQTTQGGRVTYLAPARRPGYLQALAHLVWCALRFYLLRVSLVGSSTAPHYGRSVGKALRADFPLTRSPLNSLPALP